MEDDDYSFSNSDDGLDKEEKTMLDEYKSKSKHNYNKKNAVLEFDDDDDDDDEGGISENEDDGDSDIDMGSDIEEQQDYMPDDRAWGQKRKNYYNTDFVDQDYFGSYNAKEAEAAELEEEEAKNIQKRLMEQIHDDDFFTDFKSTAADAQIVDEREAIIPDVNKLSKSEKLRFLKKNIPEFANLVNDYEEKSIEVSDRILPVLSLFENGQLPKSTAGDFLRVKYRILLNYLVNISYYILLKLKMTPAKNHPVLKAILRYKQLLNQLQSVDDEIIAPQVKEILKSIEQSKDIAALQDKITEKKGKKKMLKVLKKVAPKRKLEDESDDDISSKLSSLEEGNSKNETEMASILDLENKKSEKRAITYEMAKNKGLTPKRSKEQRNPRVKHRNKFRKASIRRRGQVRTPRSEIPVYGGEPTGIKTGLKKGRKIM